MRSRTSECLQFAAGKIRMQVRDCSYKKGYGGKPQDALKSGKADSRLDGLRSPL